MRTRENIKLILNRKLKIDKVMSQKELAEKVNVTPATITKWLSGSMVPDIENIPDICKILNVSLNEFFGIPDDNILSLENRFLLKKIEKNPAIKDIIMKLKD